MIGLALSGNVEGDAVIDGGAHERQTDGDVHPLLDAEASRIISSSGRRTSLSGHNTWFL